MKIRHLSLALVAALFVSCNATVEGASSLEGATECSAAKAECDAAKAECSEAKPAECAEAKKDACCDEQKADA